MVEDAKFYAVLLNNGRGQYGCITDNVEELTSLSEHINIGKPFLRIKDYDSTAEDDFATVIINAMSYDRIEISGIGTYEEARKYLKDRGELV